MKVYAVTEGCYSDYHVCGITLDKEAAKAFCEKYPECNIEEYDTDSIDFVKRGSHMYNLAFSEYGDLLEIKAASLYEVDYKNKVVALRKNWANTNFGYEQTYRAVVEATDEDHAVKIAADLIAKYKARHE